MTPSAAPNPVADTYITSETTSTPRSRSRTTCFPTRTTRPEALVVDLQKRKKVHKGLAQLRAAS